MKASTRLFAATTLVRLLVISISLTAQDNSPAPSRYIVKDLGTFHGDSTAISLPGRRRSIF